MRRVLFLLLLAVTLGLAGCAGVATPIEFFEVQSHDDLTDKALTVENDYLRLDFDCATTQFTLTEKATGRVWYSNPPDAAQDSLAVKTTLEKLQSQLVLYYGQKNGVVTEINNYALSVANGNFSWELLEDGIKATYTVGKVERVFMLPGVMTETRYRPFYDQMTAEQQKALDNYYRIIDFNKLRATDDKDALLELYPDLENERMFVLRDGLQKNIMDRLEGYFESIGYTEEDYWQDQAAGAAGEGSKTPVFNLSVIYKLDGPDFTVTVPMDEIEYRYDYPLMSLTVLPYFGAGSVNDEGFMLVPDGSGAVINFNNGKQNQTAYSNAVYGYDYGLQRAAIVNDNGAYFPVFGLNNNGASLLCVLEDGAANAVIEADVSRRMHSYNTVNSKFTVLKWDDVDISKASVYAKAFERKELTGVLSQRYIFLDEASDGYEDMAKTYRQYLTDRNPSLQKREEEEVPFVLNLVGAVDRTINVAGLPVVTAYPLTTYEQVIEIIKSLNQEGVKQPRINYTGWFNGGVVHDTPANVSLISGLGGKKGFNNLLNYTQENDLDLYFEADFTFIYDIGLFNGYSVNRDVARRLNRKVAQLYPYSYIWFGERTGTYGKRYNYYLATPEYTLYAIDRFYTQLTDLGGQNITFGSIGRSVNSDFNVKKPVNRGEVVQLQREKLSALSSTDAKLMIHGGNDYAVPYADFILDMELESKNFNILDESVPFYQMVLHGLVPYTGSPLNLAADYEYAILKTVETGAGLQFQMMRAAGEDIQDTNYTRYFASDFSRWGARAAELYRRLNGELARTVNLYMTGHRKLSASAYLTEYEDGTKVIVNYAKEPFEYEGRVVSGMDFLVVES